MLSCFGDRSSKNILQERRIIGLGLLICNNTAWKGKCGHIQKGNL
jgi:hypothetical protein